MVYKEEFFIYFFRQMLRKEYIIDWQRSEMYPGLFDLDEDIKYNIFNNILKIKKL